jgi:hypothetical protein
MKLRNDPITLVETSVGKNISKKKKHKTKPLKKKDKTQLGSNLHNHEKHTHIQRHSNASSLVEPFTITSTLTSLAPVVGQCHINQCIEFLSQGPQYWDNSANEILKRQRRSQKLQEEQGAPQKNKTKEENIERKKEIS